MKRQFCPDYGALSTHLGYRPMHSWFAGEKLRLTPIKGSQLHFPTYAQARNAAKQYVAEQINGRDRSEKMEGPVPDALEGEALAFLARRDEAAAEEKVRVFGAVGPAMVYPGRGRPPVAVEHRQRRRA